jgi:hypothetical protein
VLARFQLAPHGKIDGRRFRARTSYSPRKPEPFGQRRVIVANNPDTLRCDECQKPTPVAEGALCSDCRHDAETMTTCPDCTKKISKRAPACIHCGAPLISAPVATPTTSSPGIQRQVSNGVFLGGIGVAIFLVGAFMLLDSLGAFG